MAKINLKQYGITGTTEVIYNPSYDELYREETRKGLRGYGLTLNLRFVLLFE